MDVRALNLDDFAEWARQLGMTLDQLREHTGHSDSRATKMRLKKGGAQRVRAELLEALLDLERKRPARTKMGSAVLGFQEWCELGAKLAELDPDLFEIAIARTRAVVVGREAEAELERMASRKG